MHERFVDVTSKFGTIPSFFVAAEESGQYPAVILYMDAPGIREELRNIARRIAKQGYACIVPDLYHRYGKIRFDLPRRHDGMSQVIKAAYLGLTDDDINEDTAGLIGFLDAQPQVRPGRIGSIGYCMSGRFVTTTAKAFPDRFACAASLYGTRMVLEDDETSPHLHLQGIKAEMHYAFGALDQTTPPDYIKTFTESLDAAKVNYTMKTFSDADHGYAFAERAMYHAEAAEETYATVFDLFDRNLR